MASAAAQKYFNSLPASEQARAKASWGGKDMMDEWFNNAVQAGAVQATGEQRDPNAGAGSAYAAQTGHTQGQSQGVGGSSGLKPGQTPNPGQLRQYAKENGWSEDFDRFNDATLQQWINNNWDAKAMKFTSEKGVPGYVEKPVDVPEGYTAWGQGAISTADAQAKMAAWGQQPQTQQAQPGLAPPPTSQAGAPQKPFEFTPGPPSTEPVRQTGVIKTDRTQNQMPAYSTWQKKYGPKAGPMQANRALGLSRKFAGPLKLGM
jgi:hypothetical protein